MFIKICQNYTVTFNMKRTDEIYMTKEMMKASVKGRIQMGRLRFNEMDHDKST